MYKDYDAAFKYLIEASQVHNKLGSHLETRRTVLAELPRKKTYSRKLKHLQDKTWNEFN